MSYHEEPLFPWEDDETVWQPVKETLGGTFNAYRKLQAENGPSGLFPGTVLRVIKSKYVPKNAKAVLLPWRTELEKQKTVIGEVCVTNKAGRSTTYKLFRSDRWDIITYSLHDAHLTYFDHCMSDLSPD